MRGSNRATETDSGGGWPLVARTILAILVGFSFLVVVIHSGATLLVKHRGTLSAVDRLKATNDARTSLIQLLAGIGLIGGLIFTVRTYSLTRHTQRTDRFAKAVEQIGNTDSETVRAGGVYTLWLLAVEADEYWPSIEMLVSALVRERAKPGLLLGADVQAALTVLGQRPRRPPGQRGTPLNLRGVDLTGADLVGANLERAWLDGSCLTRARLMDARLGRATLNGACLDGADMSSADLSSATLAKASLRGTILYQASVVGADVYGCDFAGAEVRGCDLATALNLTEEQRASTALSPPSPP